MASTFSLAMIAKNTQSSSIPESKKHTTVTLELETGRSSKTTSVAGTLERPRLHTSIRWSYLPQYLSREPNPWKPWLITVSSYSQFALKLSHWISRPNQEAYLSSLSLLLEHVCTERKRPKETTLELFHKQKSSRIFSINGDVQSLIAYSTLDIALIRTQLSNIAVKPRVRHVFGQAFQYILLEDLFCASLV